MELVYILGVKEAKEEVWPERLRSEVEAKKGDMILETSQLLSRQISNRTLRLYTRVCKMTELLLLNSKRSEQNAQDRHTNSGRVTNAAGILHCVTRSASHIDNLMLPTLPCHQRLSILSSTQCGRPIRNPGSAPWPP
jgi:hypothetical protein